MNKAHVTHPELKATFCLDVLGVKKNPNGAMYSSLGVITKGTIIEVNVSELGLVTPGGKVVWGKYAQVGLGYVVVWLCNWWTRAA
jgi:ribosome biogenesis protein NSA2